MRNNNAQDLFIREPYFSDISSGIKTIEGRIAKSYLRNLIIGSEINFIRARDRLSVATQVNSLYVYGSFYDMLQYEDLEAILPRCKSIEQGVQVYENLPDFRQQASKFGVIAIRFSLISNR